MTNHFPWQNYLPTHSFLSINFQWVLIISFYKIHLPTPPKTKTYLPLPEEHVINHPPEKLPTH